MYYYFIFHMYYLYIGILKEVLVNKAHQGKA